MDRRSASFRDRFFFSSRRRHTRFDCDWSSDVCSSDLDGRCVLCSAAAHFVLRHDKRRRFRLLAAQTPLGAAIYTHYGLDSTNYQTNIVLEDGRALLKSESSIRILERLGFPWSLAAVARVLPRGLRDRLYDVIARNRLKWFGVRETCLVSTPDDADRF